MKQMTLVVVFILSIFTAVDAFSQNAAIIQIPTQNQDTNAPPDPCSVSANDYSRQACERMQQAQRARNKASEAQSNVPAEMPAWQKALQPPEVKIQSEDKN